MRRDEFTAAAAEQERDYRANLARTVEALRDADAASASVQLSDPGNPSAQVSYAPVETDGRNTLVRFDVERYRQSGGETYHKRLALQVTLDQAVKELAVEHVERAGFLWNGGLIDNLVVRIDAEDGSVAAAVRRPH